MVAIVLTSLAWLTACGQDRPLSGVEKAAVLAYSEGIMDNLFAGLTANDYATFSRDFDSDMLRKIPAADFANWKQDMDSKFGSYLSRQVDQVSQSDEFYVVVYQAKFELEEPVIVGVAFHAVEPHAISHMWFDSVTPQQK